MIESSREPEPDQSILEKAQQVDAMAEYVRSGGKCHPDFYRLAQDVACWAVAEIRAKGGGGKP